MTRARIHHRGIGIPAIVVAATLALSGATAPASARTFDFNSAGSMVQQPLPPKWGCIMRHLLSGQAEKIECRESPGHYSTVIRASLPQALIAALRQPARD